MAVVVVLDERWPELVPIDLIGQLEAPVLCSVDIPVKVRWHIERLLGPEPQAAAPAAGESIHGTLLSCSVTDELSRQWIAAGATVIEVASRREETHRARALVNRALAVGQWEREQSHESLLPWLADEAAEFAAEVRAANYPAMVEELGDLYLQVLFHAALGSKSERFDLDDIARSLRLKLERRAPYLLDPEVLWVSAQEQDRLWQQAKAAERAQAASPAAQAASPAAQAPSPAAQANSSAVQDSAR